MQTPDNVLEEQGVSASDLEGMLDELQKHVEPIHMANDLHTIGGLPPLLKYLRNSHANIQDKAAEVANRYQRDVIASSWFSKPNSYRKKKVIENKTAGAGEGAADMSTIHMDDDEVPKLVVCDRRKDSSEPAGLSINGPSIAATPYIRRISLRMSVIALQNYTTYEVCISTDSPSLRFFTVPVPANMFLLGNLFRRINSSTSEEIPQLIKRLAVVFIFSNVVLVFRWVAAIVFGSVIQKPNSSSKKDNGDSDNIMISCKLFGFALTEVPQLLYAKGLSNRSLLKGPQEMICLRQKLQKGTSMAKGGSTYNMSDAPVTVFVHLLVISIATLTLVWLLKFHGGFAFKADHFYKNKIFNVLSYNELENQIDDLNWHIVTHLEQDVQTFTCTMLTSLWIEYYEKKLDKDEFQEDRSMAAFWVINKQFQMFIDSQFTWDYDSQMTEKYFVEYTRIEVRQFRDSLIQHMESVKKLFSSKALDAMFKLLIEFSGQSQMSLLQAADSGTYITHSVDADIIPVNDQVSSAEISSGHRFSPRKTSAVYEKTSPRSCLRWKPTGKIFTIVSLKWIPTGMLFDSCTSKVDNKPPNGSNDDVTNPYECNQTLNISAGTLNLSAVQASDLNVIKMASADNTSGPVL
ncbi:retrovirus-related pol polyprotein from transposon TNT 1-94 [Tanacetum coccineum]